MNEIEHALSSEPCKHNHSYQDDYRCKWGVIVKAYREQEVIIEYWRKKYEGICQTLVDETLDLRKRNDDCQTKINELEALWDKVACERAEAYTRIAALEMALKQFGSHKYAECQVTCSCGFQEALSGGSHE